MARPTRKGRPRPRRISPEGACSILARTEASTYLLHSVYRIENTDFMIIRLLILGAVFLVLSWAVMIVLARRLPPGLAKDLASFCRQA